MQRYFAKDDNEKLELRDSDIHHIKNVMRMKIDDKIEVVYNNKLYICNIDGIDPLLLSVIKEEETNNINLDVTIAVGLVKEQKFDLILQKLTELGVNRIIPVKMERSIVKLGEEKIDKKMARWTSICKEASEQSKRTSIPVIENIMSIKDICKLNSDIKLVASTIEKDKTFDFYLHNIPNYAKIIIVIGPEGGISPLEEENLINSGYSPVSFGNLVFRVETATIYAASICNFYSNMR